MSVAEYVAKFDQLARFFKVLFCFKEDRKKLDGFFLMVAEWHHETKSSFGKCTKVCKMIQVCTKNQEFYKSSKKLNKGLYIKPETLKVLAERLGFSHLVQYKLVLKMLIIG